MLFRRWTAVSGRCLAGLCGFMNGKAKTKILYCQFFCYENQCRNTENLRNFEVVFACWYTHAWDV